MKLAQVGYGYWGRNLLRVFAGQPDAQIVLCCDPDPKARKALRDVCPAMEVCSHPQEVADRKEIDAAILATPAGLHAEQCRLLLRAGKHVFVEKTLALSLPEAEEIRDLARKTDRILMVGHTFLYNDAVRWVKDYIRKGEAGRIYYA